MVARSVPFAYIEKTEEELKFMEKSGIIEIVTKPSDWSSDSLVVPKPNGSVRLVVDFTALNKYVKQPIHPFSSAKDISTSIPASSKWFVVLDAVKGYWQVELDPASRHLTTFLTPFGRYRYCRAPMGLNASGNEFCARGDRALAGLPGVRKIVDDILICADSYKDLAQKTEAVLKRCEENNITLSKTKAQIGSFVKFAGYVIGPDGVRPDPAKVATISKFPAPTNLTDLRSFLGLTNQLGPVLGHFDPSLPTFLLTDASCLKGLGYALLQTHANGESKLIQCGSRYLSDAETRYAVCEIEALAVQWAVQKCRIYLLGMHFTVITDHRPLLGIFKGSNLASMDNPRLQRMLIKLSGYTFDIQWTPGKSHHIADSLSRYPLFDEPQSLEDDVNWVTINLTTVQANAHPNLALDSISKNAKEDINYQAVVSTLLSGQSPKSLPQSHPSKLYSKQWDDLSFDETTGLLILQGHRIVLPPASRPSILRGLHASHQGIRRTRAWARHLYFWPGMNNDIDQVVSSCSACQEHRPSQLVEPLIQSTASRPFEAISVDIFESAGAHYLIMADRFSGWPCVARLSRMDTQAVINILQDWFVDYGIPQTIRSDGGPQFRSQFAEFCHHHHITHELASAYHPVSNGHAESTVKSMKILLQKHGHDWRSFRGSLLDWRNVPCADGLSQAQWLFNRRLRTLSPGHGQLYERLSEQDWLAVLEKRRGEAEKIKAPFDAHALTQGRSMLTPQTRVLVQNPRTKKWDRSALILRTRPDGRSYEILMDGRTVIRNRCHLRPHPTKSTRRLGGHTGKWRP
ncbi:uncharacterized protein K02A2.6-like [Tigriopus californicus]|uniref:uncharacterized protein K02A2.6-like n=1 Tax=Tigriopus californicus TaxID=6832 RepID=UPI0027DA460E|nr:uncharacterized protein K02A2.6-like [Tigriopus californicus]